MNKRNFLFGILLFLSALLSAQTYPVQLSLQLVPPFSGYIPDYGAPGNENFRVLALFTDFSHASYDVKLKIKIEGQGIRIESKSWYFSGPFTLTPGVPQLLSGNDLSGLLNENNLDFSGITQQQYDQRRILPEGFYTITLTAFDFQNPLPVQVSNDAIAQAWMVLNDPPMLNFPMCGSQIIATTPQQITFSWTQMNTGPSSALGTEFTFELWEIFPANSNPGNIVATTAPLFSITTSQTILDYGITEPPLVEGRSYVWRVRARDLEGRELFRNNGYSSLCTFTFGNINSQLGNNAEIHLAALALSHRLARCTWDSISVYTSYHFEFRKTGSTNWFPVNTDHASLRIPDLEPDAYYEAEVQGIFADGSPGPWSNIATWHTQLQPQYNCGETSPSPAMQNFHPLTQATTNMTWQVGQFEMNVTTLQNFSSSGGWYSGTGKIILPFGWTVACTYHGICVGDDHVMYSGEVNAESDGIANWMLQYNRAQFQYDTSYFFNGGIDSLYVDGNGNVVIIDDNGNSHTVDIDTGGGVLFTDANGDQWVVNPDGTVTFVTGGFLLPFTNDTLNATEMQILKLAMTTIRNQLSDNSITAQKNEMDQRQSALQSFITTQQQSVSAQHVPDDGTLVADTTVIVSFSESDGNASDNGYQLGNAFKSAQVDYYSSRVLKVMSRADCPDAELNFIGQYLAVNGTPYKQFVALQLSQGKTQQQIAGDVAENGVKKLVAMVLKKQMSR